jgi:hypothetical protein
MDEERSLKINRLRDHKYYLENFCKIKTKVGGLAPFILNEAQKDFFNALRKNNRTIILKARQLGFSTAVTGYFYVDTITNPGITTALIGYNTELVSELLDKVKTFYRTTPAALKPTIQYNSKYEISFPKLDSKIIVLPSTENVGRGYTIHNCLCTELSAWDKADEKMMSLEASVPINGKLVIESTPRGQGNLYHRLWMTDNDYVKKMYGWWWGYSQSEMETIKRRMNNDRMFAQEFECEFLSSGRSVFDWKMVKIQRNNILSVGDYREEINFTVNEEDGFVFYAPPVKDGLYVIGADISEGIEGGDYSVATIWDRRSGEEVAMYRGLMAPDLFGNLLNKWGRAYNNAFMVPEINNHGLTTVTILRQLMYPSLYFRPTKFDAITGATTDRIGWKTTKMTRPLLINDFNQATRDGLLTIHSKALLDEMSVFIYNDNNDMVPQSGFHDDCIFSAAIGYQGFKILYDKKLDQLNYEAYMPKSFSY